MKGKASNSRTNAENPFSMNNAEVIGLYSLSYLFFDCGTANDHLLFQYRLSRMESVR
jgi:hypothetical protein